MKRHTIVLKAEDVVASPCRRVSNACFRDC